MFIDSGSLLDPSLQRSEMQCFDVLNYQYIALRWSAKQLSRPRVYKHLAPLEPEHGGLYNRSTYYIICSNWTDSIRVAGIK